MSFLLNTSSNIYIWNGIWNLEKEFTQTFKSKLEVQVHQRPSENTWQTFPSLRYPDHAQDQEMRHPSEPGLPGGPSAVLPCYGHIHGLGPQRPCMSDPESALGVYRRVSGLTTAPAPHVRVLGWQAPWGRRSLTQRGCEERHPLDIQAQGSQSTGANEGEIQGRLGPWWEVSIDSHAIGPGCVRDLPAVMSLYASGCMIHI